MSFAIVAGIPKPSVSPITHPSSKSFLEGLCAEGTMAQWDPGATLFQAEQWPFPRGNMARGSWTLSNQITDLSALGRKGGAEDRAGGEAELGTERGFTLCCYLWARLKEPVGSLLGKPELRTCKFESYLITQSGS